MAKAAPPQGPQETAVKCSTATCLGWSADETAELSMADINSVTADLYLIDIFRQ
jgi:hypothetical protein